MTTNVVVFQPVTLPPPPKFEYGPSYEKWSTEKVEQFVAFLAGVLTYISSSCVPLLQRKEPLSYQEWRSLFEWVWTAWNSSAGSLALPSLFSRTVWRGINDLAIAIDNFEGDDQQLAEECSLRGPVLGAWLAVVEDQLCPERIPDEDTRRQLTYLFIDEVIVPLCQICQKTKQCSGILHRLGRKLHPRDQRAQDAFVTVVRERAGF